jgi:hypothetical protein
MTTHKLAAALAATLVLGTATASFAQETSVSAQAPSTRSQRRFSVAGVGTLVFPTPLLGVQTNYHLTDRLALNAQLSLGMPVVDAAVGARFFLLTESRSGLFVDAGAHALAGIGMHALGGAGEVGYQYRGPSGFLVEASAGVMVLNVDGGCGCGSKPGSIKRSPWGAFPAVNLRLGYAY